MGAVVEVGGRGVGLKWTKILQLVERDIPAAMNGGFGEVVGGF